MATSLIIVVVQFFCLWNFYLPTDKDRNSKSWFSFALMATDQMHARDFVTWNSFHEISELFRQTHLKTTDAWWVRVYCSMWTKAWNGLTLLMPICVSRIVCGCDLAQGGFFMKNGEYLCMLDYQRMHGTRCNGCGDFVEGEVVTALGKTYHPTCFVCTICK